MKNRNLIDNKAITLIALVITIIILLMLAGISISMLSGQDGILNKASSAKEKTESANKKDKDAMQSIEGLITDALETQYDSKKGVNKPKLSEGMIPVKYDGTTWVVCSEDDTEWYNYADMKWANIMLSDGTYKAGSVTVGQEVTDRELGSMFVWIPRYAYSIKEYRVAQNGEGTKQELTNVNFLVGTTNKDGKGTEYAIDYNVDEQETGKATPMIVHPAFKFGDRDITGFWTAKFEASMTEENLNTVENNDVTDKTVKILPNKNSWRYIGIGNSFINCLNMNKAGNVYGLNENSNSHLMKNNEWGAVTYLTVSQYGVTPVGNYKMVDYTENISIYTAGSEIESKYKINITQSTTGNITGIYDLNGGSAEFVASYWDNTSENLSKNGTNNVFINNKLKEEYMKYWDRYEVSQNEITEINNGLWEKDSSYNNIRKTIADERYNLMKNIKGDAIYETMREYSYYGKNTEEVYDIGRNEIFSSPEYSHSIYNSDTTLLGNSMQTFCTRGGHCDMNTGSGLFVLLTASGIQTKHVSFRPVIVI